MKPYTSIALNRINTAGALATVIRHIENTPRRKSEPNLYKAVQQVLELELREILKLGHQELTTVINDLPSI